MLEVKKHILRGDNMECTYMEECGMNDVIDGRCCFYCEYKEECNGYCSELEEDCDNELNAKRCIYLKENE